MGGDELPVLEVGAVGAGDLGPAARHAAVAGRQALVATRRTLASPPAGARPCPGLCPAPRPSLSKLCWISITWYAILGRGRRL